MHLMFPSGFHLLGDVEPVGVVQRAQRPEHHLPWVELGRAVGRGAAAPHRVVLEGTTVKVWVLETRTVG